MFTKTIIFALAGSVCINSALAAPAPAHTTSSATSTITGSPAGLIERDDEGKYCTSEGAVYDCALSTNYAPSFTDVSLPTPAAAAVAAALGDLGARDEDEGDEYTDAEADDDVEAEDNLNLEARSNFKEPKATTHHGTLLYGNSADPITWGTLSIHPTDPDCQTIAGGFTHLTFSEGLVCTIFQNEYCHYGGEVFSSQGLRQWVTGFIDVTTDAVSIKNGLGNVSSVRC